jgi:hypothetical protein
MSGAIRKNFKSETHVIMPRPTSQGRKSIWLFTSTLRKGEIVHRNGLPCRQVGPFAENKAANKGDKPNSRRSLKKGKNNEISWSFDFLIFSAL